MEYEFEVIGDIKGKERPRVNTNTGIVYTPARTKDYEDLIKQYFLLKYPRYTTIEGRTSIDIIAYMKIPKKTSKKKESKMLEGEISPIKKPDIDNVAKVVLDALNKIVFKDDNQICKINVEKKYGEEEKLYIKICDY